MKPTPIGELQGIASTSDPAVLESAMSRGIRAPLAALRATLESLAHDLPQNDPRAATLAGALSELVRMGHHVEALYEYSVPALIRPLRCTVEEIVRGALRSIRKELRATVRIALESGSGSLNVDGPILANCLAEILEHAIERGAGEVLFHARQERGTTIFAIVHDVAIVATHVLVGPGSATRRPEESFEVALAKRDIIRMGGMVEVLHAEPTHQCLTIRVPSDVSERGAA